MKKTLDAAREKQITASRDLPSAIFLFAALAILVVPVLAVKMPPLLDYPNHYVRMWLLGGGLEIFPLSEMYGVLWRNASANIGIDIIATLLGSFLPITIIGPLVLLLALAMPPLGAALLNRNVFGGVHWWQVVFVLLAWSQTTLSGLLNFDIGLGAALLGAAIDPPLSRRGVWIAAIGRLCIAALILVVHPFGLLFYALLVGAIALGQRFAPLKTPREAGPRLRSAATACLPAMIPLVLWALSASNLPGAHLGAHSGAPADQNSLHMIWACTKAYDQMSLIFSILSCHASMMMTSFKTYNIIVDLVFLTIFALPIALGMATRHIQVHAGLFVTAILLVVLSNFMPFDVAGTAWIDKRLPPMAVLTLAASVRPELPLSRRWQWAALVAALLVVAIRTLWITNIWVARQADILSVERALARVPAGSAVLPMENDPPLQDIKRAVPGRFLYQSQPVFWSYPALAVIERHAFSPILFTAAGKQPLVVLPPWDQIAKTDVPPAPVNLIDDSQAARTYPYLAHWRDRFDFLLVVNADMRNKGGPLPSLPQLQLVADEGFARLYRIIKTADQRAAHE